MSKPAEFCLVLLVNFIYSTQEGDYMATIKETFTIHGENLLKKVKELIAEGNIRKITITEKNGREIMSFPLTIGVAGVVLAPILAAVGAVAALIGECSISVEREKPEDPKNE
jgi:hypothetical protein